MWLIALALAAAQPASDILHYVRSNLDGSEAEHVVQFRPSSRDISVYKWVERCTRAAYVTARMDAAVRQPVRFTAGRLGKSGEQLPFGTLSVTPDGTFSVELTPPGQATVRDQLKVAGMPAYLFDFDFADLNARLQQSRPKRDFGFELPVIWPDDAPKIFRDLGRVTAQYAGTERHLGRRTRRFDLSLAGPSAGTGTLWIDARSGLIVEARLNVPNHSEYRDFRLRLERIERGTLPPWNDLLKSHYAGCPAGN